MPPGMDPLAVLKPEKLWSCWWLLLRPGLGSGAGNVQLLGSGIHCEGAALPINGSRPGAVRNGGTIDGASGNRRPTADGCTLNRRVNSHAIGIGCNDDGAICIQNALAVQTAGRAPRSVEALRKEGEETVGCVGIG